MTPPRVAGYAATRLLGAGGSGEVWLARDERSGEEVALKRVRRGAGPADAEQRLRREAVVLSALAHPHLLRLRDVLVDVDGLVLVVDLARGGSLAALVRARGRLAPGEVVTMAAPVAQALDLVHGSGVVHGDVSPGNVLFTEDGRPLLADLGIAGVLGEASARAVLGTSGYWDPVLASGAARGPASDVHGLGATCFAALTGVPPFSGTVRRSLRDLAPATPAALALVVEQAMAPEPGDRPSAAELAEALLAAEPPAPVVLAAAPAGAAGAPYRGPEVTEQVARAEPPEEDGPHEPGSRRDRALRAAARSVARARPAAVVAVAVLALLLTLLGGRLVASLGGSPAEAGAAAEPPAPGRAAAERAAPERATPEPAAPEPPEGSPTAVPAAGSPSPNEVATSAPPPLPPPDMLPAEWEQVLADRYRMRSLALEIPDAALLTDVYAPGSPDLAANTSILEQMEQRGLAAERVRLEVLDVLPLREGGTRATLLVTDRLHGYELVDATGAVVQEAQARGEESVEVDLVWHDGRWLIARTRPATP